MEGLNGVKIHITGIVQGVGFRPFVFGLAQRYALQGWVRNTSAGVDIEVAADSSVLEEFIQALQDETPPLARIDSFETSYKTPGKFTTFEIIHSHTIQDAFQPISPDVSICNDCLKELFDPEDRRYLYPFINCTNCGPRFTIIRDIPYDRPKTTMANFPMCESCAAEYNNPLDRRFHAQPIACPICGPQVWLETSNEQITGEALPISERVIFSEDAILDTCQRLLDGEIVAIKGLGGFHLACNALDIKAVSTLRQRKLRVDKPFALMMPDLLTIEEHCFINDAEHQLLVTRQRPIVILNRKPQSRIAAQLAPGQNTFGVMLPYTPLHYMLFRQISTELPPLSVLVMTSGNLSEEPIAAGNDEARHRLRSLADAYLMHDRPIYIRCDDSVVRVLKEKVSTLNSDRSTNEPANTVPLRRSRGYAPFPIRLPVQVPPILAVGAELKNTFCITREDYAFLSQHIGDLENYETLKAFESGTQHFEKLFRISPHGIAHDLHPDYLATRYAIARGEKEGIATFGIQHHHAHIAAVMAEHSLPGDNHVIGLTFDGTGFGDDGAIWGGEIMVANYKEYQRLYHLQYTPLPGGDTAVREPWRMALSWLHTTQLPWQDSILPLQFALTNRRDPRRSLDVLKHQIQNRVNAPLTSSMGRLFDAVASLAGVRHVVNYEAQAAIEFEALADNDESGHYPLLRPQQSQLDLPQPLMLRPTLESILKDIQDGVKVQIISARFHNTIAHSVLELCREIRNKFDISAVALSGGVWQNMYLLRRSISLLASNDFKVYIHQHIPTNDGGLALGQAMIAANRLRPG